MPRIIPNELNKKIRVEYRLRFFSILFFALSLAIIVNVLLVSSSYLLLSIYEKIYLSNISSKQTEEISNANSQFLEKMTQVYALSQKIPSDVGNIDMRIVNILNQYANEGVNIDAIEITKDSEEFKIALRGSSLTRDTLLKFQDKIKNNPSFKGFSIPIELLTKQKDISFNLNFTYHEN